MEQLTVIGSEDGALVLANESGERFTVAVDDVLRSEIRRAGTTARPARRAAASPRDIQTHIRAGMSAEQVAELLGADIEDVRRFEGPVIAEREHIVSQALAVPVLIGSELDGDANPTFGVAIRSKLASLNATGERWTSWKDASGWIVKLEFTAGEVDHDARWSFEPRRSALAPLNSDATQLSRQGPLPEGLIPRLRALDTPSKDDSRFDTDAFGPRRLPDPEPAVDDSPAGRLATVSSREVRETATRRAPEEHSTSPETADLLEALRRRRGQRESAPMSELDESAARHPARGGAPVALFEAMAEDKPVAEQPAAPEPEPEREPEPPRRRGRASMPSWDEIVFGARSDD
ncbi:septation protein SepH [Microbacterium sp. Marseille-Q6965]|uniref:septation protein SepH n=1 Tax=Microbacterium sp. Marseille-Q6965 TaxID=2965072 RepID=UPI0021B7B19E|nr:septation protein SepH [Microbacterium sp. Marseille-Q6965]